MNSFLVYLLVFVLFINGATPCVRSGVVKQNKGVEAQLNIGNKSSRTVANATPEPVFVEVQEEPELLSKVTINNFYTLHTVDDIILLAKLISCEADGQCREGQVAVANVVKNRVHSSYFPDNIQDVILDPTQFSCAEYVQYAEYTDEMYEIAENVLVGREWAFYMDDSVLFFRNPGEGNDSDWGSYRFYQRIEDHVFYSYDP